MILFNKQLVTMIFVTIILFEKSIVTKKIKIEKKIFRENGNINNKHHIIIDVLLERNYIETHQV